MMDFSQDQASRLIDVIDSRIRARTRSSSMVETTWGTVAAVHAIQRTVDVYLYGSATASESFRILAGDMPIIGENVKVAMDKARGDRYVMEPFKNVVSTSTGDAAYDPYGAAADAYALAASDLAGHGAAGDPHSIYLTAAEGNAAYQPLDSDLTSIAALATTSYGRALLALADAAAGRTTFGISATNTPFTPNGSIVATDVQAAIQEVRDEAGGGAPVGAKAYNSAVQSVSDSTDTPLTLDTEEFDTDGLHSTASNTSRMTIPAGLGGKYLCQGSTYFAGAAPGTIGRALRIRKNGTTFNGGDVRIVPPNSTDPLALATSIILDLAAGDYVELMAYQNSGGALNIGLAPSGSDRAVSTTFSVMRIDSGAPAGGPGTELDYVQFTATVSPTATTEATANTIVTGSAVTYNGTTAAFIEFFSFAARPDTTAAATLDFYLYEDGASVGRIGTLYAQVATNPAYVPVRLARRLTPSAASHTYSIRASVSTGTGQVEAGAGGSGNAMPGFIRITRV